MSALFRHFKRRPLFYSYIIFWSLYFSFFWWNAIQINEAGNLVAGHVNIWGDWALHFTMGSAMAYRQLVLWTSPLLIGAPFAYPFGASLLSALLIRMGMPFFAAFTGPSFLMSIVFVVLLFLFMRRLLGSDAAALSGSVIYLFNGGLGFIEFFKDLLGSTSFWSTLVFPPRLYTRINDLGIHWISVIDSMMIPQRAFLFGFPISLGILIVVYKHVFERVESSRKRSLLSLKQALLLSAIVTGIMPIIHAHSFLALGIILPCWAIADFVGHPERKVETIKRWTLFALISLGIACPLIFTFLIKKDHGSGMTRWFVGWYARQDHRNWFWFWLLNWGLVPILALFGYGREIVHQRTPSERITAALKWGPFFILFVAMNLILFQPWIWDNTKILAWVSLGFSGLSGALFAEWWSRSRNVWRKTTVGAVGFVLIFSGALDAYRLQLPRFNRYQMYSAEDLSLVEWIKTKTPRDAIFLTGFYHNHWLFNLTGRQTVMAYEGWLWTHGYRYSAIKEDVEALFHDASRADLMEKHGVDYVVVGPFEREKLRADERGFSKSFRVVHRTATHQIFEIHLDERGIPARTTVGAAHHGLLRTVYASVDFTGPAQRTESVTSVDFHYNAGERSPFPTPCSIVWDGYLRIEKEARYEFVLSSDDGSWLEINGKRVVDNGGQHALQSKVGFVALKPGLHRFVLRYFDKGGGKIVGLKWRSSQDQLKPIDETALFFDSH